MTTPKLLSKILLPFLRLDEKYDCQVSDLTQDSRTVKPGDVFFALSGTTSDGGDFISQAISAGAKAIITQGKQAGTCVKDNIPIISIPDLKPKVGLIAAEFFDDPSQDMKIIGVTGTNGKTSTSQFIAQALKMSDISCGVIGTIGNGLVGQLTPTERTTPDAISTQRLLMNMRAAGAKAVSMEVSSHALEQFRVNGVKFDVALFTNLTRDHLDYHHDMAHYAGAKKRLFEMPGLRYGVVNADDVFGQTLQQELANTLEWFSYSITEANATVLARDAHFDASGFSAKIFSPWGGGEFHTSLLGKFNLSNILGVFTTLCLLKLPFEKVLASISQLKGVDGRMQTFGGNNKPLVVVDYAHTPDALQQVLRALRQHCNGKLWCVFGCGGDRDPGKRSMMGQIAERFADRVVVTNDNPRSEDPEKIVKDILAGFEAAARIRVQHHRGKAIAETIQQAADNDIVLIAGKGHETYQEIGNERLHFSDAEQVRELL